MGVLVPLKLKILTMATFDRYLTTVQKFRDMANNPAKLIGECLAELSRTLSFQQRDLEYALLGPKAFFLKLKSEYRILLDTPYLVFRDKLVEADREWEIKLLDAAFDRKEIE